MRQRSIYAYANPRFSEASLYYGDMPNGYTSGPVIPASEEVALSYFQQWIDLCEPYFSWYTDDMPLPQRKIMVGMGAQYAGPAYGNITGTTHDVFDVKKPSTKFPNHKFRMKHGEVLLSEHVHSKCRLSYNTGTVEKRGQFISTVTRTVTDPFSGGWKNYADYVGATPVTDWSMNSDTFKMVQVAPRVWLHARFTFDLFLVTIEEGYHPLDFGFKTDHFEALCSYNEFYPIENQISIDGALVTAVMADANDGDIDILTSLAELPMTVSAALGGLTKAFSMLRDVKTLDFKKSKVSDSTLQRWKRDFYEKQLAAKHARRGTTPRVRVKSPEDLYQHKEKAVLAFATEFLDNTSSTLLWWRYDLRPNLYLLDDHIKHMESMMETDPMRRYRKKVTKQHVLPEFEGWTFEGTSTATYRYTVLRHYFLMDWLSKVKRSLQIDTAVTLWELLWGSFMVDWLLNVGDVLAAMPDHRDDEFYNQGVYVSVKHEIKGLYRYDANPSISVVVNLESYKSTPIDPTKYLGFYFRNNLDAFKILDAVAIAWGLSSPKVKGSPIFKYL